MDPLKIIPVRVKIASIVRNAILAGEYADGEELSLTDTANRLGVSRTPVREAFQTLAAEGLIELRMNRGAVVKPIDEQFITDHFGMRRLLEGEAVYRAIVNGMPAEAVDDLQRTAEQSGPGIANNEYDNYNQEFHMLFWKGAGSQKLHSFLETLWDGPSYSRVVGSDVDHEKSIAEHGQILRHLKKGEPEKGREVMHRHIDRSLAIILHAMTKSQKRT